MIARPSNIAMNFAGVFLILGLNALQLTAISVGVAAAFIIYNIISFHVCNQNGL